VEVPVMCAVRHRTVSREIERQGLAERAVAFRREGAAVSFYLLPTLKAFSEHL